MANVAHSTLSGSNLHENKGVATASDNTVATASSGSTVWQKLTADHLTGTGNPFGGQLFHVRCTSLGADATISASTWQTRTLNSSVTNQITGASLGSNRISLPAGTYHVKAKAPILISGAVGGSVLQTITRIRLRDITNSATKAVGASSYFYSGTTGQNVQILYVCELEGRFTLAGTANLELQMYANSNNSIFGGVSSSDGESDVFSEVYIWKVG